MLFYLFIYLFILTCAYRWIQKNNLFQNQNKKIYQAILKKKIIYIVPIVFLK
jgi:hypothetical protein